MVITRRPHAHPDKNPGDEEEAAERFVRLHLAYQTLMDLDTREAYDTLGTSSTSFGSSGVFNVGVFLKFYLDLSSLNLISGNSQFLLSLAN